jgi:glycosyltransferase involved in cell wall biosynthesis
MSSFDNEKINILYISYDGMTDQLGQSQVIPYLKELTKLGDFNFVLLSCEKKEMFIKNKEVVEAVLKDFSITWHPQIYHKSPPVLSTLFDIWKLYRNAKKLHKIHHFKFLHCRSYISSLIGLEFKRKYRIPFIFDMRGFWADERVDGKLWNLRNPIFKIIYNYFKKKETQFLHESSSIISLTEAGKNEILKWKNITITPDKIKIIPCCVDLEHFSDKTLDVKLIEKTKSKNNIGEKDFILTYLGAIGTWYMLPEMLFFFYLLQQQKKECKFLFIAPTDAHSLILEEARKNNVPSEKLILIHAQRKEVPSILSLSNYSIYFILPAYSKISSSPTKQAEIMAMGIPSITNKGIGDTENIITNSNAGLITEDFSDNSFQKIIKKIIEGDVLTSKNEIRNGAVQYYSLDSGAKKYFKIYKEILKKNTNQYIES